MSNSDAIFVVKFVAIGQPELSVAYPAFATDFRNCVINMCNDIERHLLDKPDTSQGIPDRVASQNAFLRRSLTGYHPEYIYGDKGSTSDTLIAHKIYADIDEMAMALLASFASNSNLTSRHLNTEEHAHFARLRLQGISESRELPLSREGVQIMRQLQKARATAVITVKKVANG